MLPMLTQGDVRIVCSRSTLAGNIVGNGERRMENGIAGFLARAPDIAHCGHLRLHSRAQQQQSMCTILRMTMAPHLGQETRNNISSDYETIPGILAERSCLFFGKIPASTIEHLNGCTQAHNYVRKVQRITAIAAETHDC